MPSFPVFEGPRRLSLEWPLQGKVWKMWNNNNEIKATSNAALSEDSGHLGEFFSILLLFSMHNRASPVHLGTGQRRASSGHWLLALASLLAALGLCPLSCQRDCPRLF